MWDKLVATVPGTQMCDDSETVKNMVLEEEDDEIGLAPTLSKFRIASSIISALSKAAHFAQTLAMPERAGVLYDQDVQKRLRWTMHDPILNERHLSALVSFALYLRLLFVLSLHQSSTQNIDKGTINSHMHLKKDDFTALGLDTTRIDEIEKLFEEDFPPAKIHELKEKLKREKGSGVKFKQIDKIELELAILKRKLADVEADVKYIQTRFTHVMTSIEGLVSGMKALKTDIAMEAGSSKGKAQWL